VVTTLVILVALHALNQNDHKNRTLIHLQLTQSLCVATEV